VAHVTGPTLYVYGYVYGDVTPLASAQVKNDLSTTAKTFTDSTGYFNLNPEMSGPDIPITVSKTGFNSATFHASCMGTPVNVGFNLVTVGWSFFGWTVGGDGNTVRANTIESAAIQLNGNVINVKFRGFTYNITGILENPGTKRLKIFLHPEIMMASGTGTGVKMTYEPGTMPSVFTETPTFKGGSQSSRLVAFVYYQ